MKSEPNEGNSDLQQLVQALKQSMMMSSEVSEARKNVRAPRVYSAGQSFQNMVILVRAVCRPCAHQAVGSSSIFTHNVGPAGL